MPLSARAKSAVSHRPGLLWAAEAPLVGSNLTHRIVATAYEVPLERATVENGSGPLEAMVTAFLALDRVMVEGWSKNGPKERDVREGVLSLMIHPEGAERARLRFVLREVPGASARPRDLLRGLLHLEARTVQGLKLLKLDSLQLVGEDLVSISGDPLTGGALPVVSRPDPIEASAP
jgi:hypothetical protein